MNRKRFLLVSGVAVAAATAPFLARRLAGGTPPLPEAEFLGRALDQTMLRAIGRAYLARHAEEADTARLTDLLLAAAGPAPNDDRLRQRLARRVEADFLEGRTVEVEGWLLARTEARQCALLSLLPG